MSTATLQIEKKRTLVPQLRFQEFDDEWKQTKLGNVCDKIQDGNYGGEYPKAYEFVENGIPFLTSKALGSNGLLKEDKIDFIPIEKHIKLKKAQLKLNDVLFTNRGSNVGSIGLTDIRIAHGNIGPQLTLLRSNLKIIIPSFLYQIMKSETTVKQIRSQDSGSAMNFFGIDTTSKFKLSIPTLQEQQKIASFLSAVDEKIQQLSRKKELLEQYKKGIMQQLFSGKLRFKDENGKDYPDWEEKKLSEVASKKSSNISANKIEDNYGDYIIYGASGILKKVDFYKEENDYVSIVKDGAGVGRLLYCKGKSSVLGTMEIISPKQGIDTYFLYCLLSNIDFIKYITGSTIPHIYFKDYSSEVCEIPTLPEQQKIANFLSSIDDKIESTKQQITQTKTFKKGLLQQMFV